MDTRTWRENFTRIDDIFTILDQDVQAHEKSIEVPIGEWARKAKYKRIEAVEARKSLENIEREISSSKEATKILKEKNVQLQGEIKELGRKVSYLRNTVFSWMHCIDYTGVLLRWYIKAAGGWLKLII